MHRVRCGPSLKNRLVFFHWGRIAMETHMNCGGELIPEANTIAAFHITVLRTVHNDEKIVRAIINSLLN